jgi:hypothetical protein
VVEALRRHVMAAGKLHADDTPVPVLAPGLGKTKTGQLPSRLDLAIARAHTHDIFADEINPPAK